MVFSHFRSNLVACFFSILISGLTLLSLSGVTFANEDGAKLGLFDVQRNQIPKARPYWEIIQAISHTISEKPIEDMSLSCPEEGVHIGPLIGQHILGFGFRIQY